MYAAVRRYRIKSGSNAEIANLAREKYLPMVNRISGFVAYYGIDTGTEEYVAVTVFNDKTGVEESSKAAASLIKENPKLTQLLPTPPNISMGSVIVSQTK